MSAHRISARYARSLFELSAERACLREVQEDMKQVEALSVASRPFRRLLESPILGEHKKVEVLRAIFKAHLHELSMRFIELMTRKGRARYLRGMAAAFIARYYEQEGFVSAELRVAAPISETLKSSFTQYVSKLTHKKPLLRHIVWPELLGGFVLRFRDQQIDKSVAAQLRKTRKTLHYRK